MSPCVCVVGSLRYGVHILVDTPCVTMPMQFRHNGSSILIDPVSHNARSRHNSKVALSIISLGEKAGGFEAMFVHGARISLTARSMSIAEAIMAA